MADEYRDLSEVIDESKLSKNKVTIKELHEAMLNLTKLLNDMFIMFQKASGKTKSGQKLEHDAHNNIISRLDEVVEENRTIAESVVALADLIKKMHQDRSVTHPHPQQPRSPIGMPQPQRPIPPQGLSSHGMHQAPNREMTPPGLHSGPSMPPPGLHQAPSREMPPQREIPPPGGMPPPGLHPGPSMPPPGMPPRPPQGPPGIPPGMAPPPPAIHPQGPPPTMPDITDLDEPLPFEDHKEKKGLLGLFKKKE